MQLNTYTPISTLRRVDPKLNCPQALCMCPTRELVVQNLSVLNRMGKFTGIRATSTATDGSDGSGFRKDPVTEQVCEQGSGKTPSRNRCAGRVLERPDHGVGQCG